MIYCGKMRLITFVIINDFAVSQTTTDNLTRNEVKPYDSVRKQTINSEFSYVTIWRRHRCNSNAILNNIKLEMNLHR